MYQDYEGTLGERIRYYRKKIKMTQKELADFCEISEPAIRNYELGNRVPDWEMLQKIAAGLKVSYYALAEPEISALFGVMHIFFRMEHLHGLRPVDIDGKTGLILEHEIPAEGEDYLQKALDTWKKARGYYDIGEWDEETYLTWESKYPAYSNEYLKEVYESEGTPGTDKAKMTKHKRPRKQKK